MKKFIKIEVEPISLEGSDILIAELSENNFYAFEQNDNDLIAYIKQEDFDATKLVTLLPPGIAYKYSIIEDRNWNKEWESNFHPVIINDFAGIRASFHKPLQNVKHEIIITPKMSFGTGHHATTFLMIDLMQKINFNNKKVLDFGTGTGILAILAEKLGAASILAIDNDEWSINNTSENIIANNCNRIITEERNTIAGISNVDIILANINFNVLTENVNNFSMLLERNSVLLLSGFLEGDEKNIISTFVKNGFTKTHMGEKEGWIGMVFKKQ
ncbi:50S ribosomal protein L11 methyltransferase [Ginsengibacter hankyongi]|uniref:Ribosomal protein L11 methyltransferase n=1 Tax=Ginsengibacter hankyongi TaxID=2607284 RepID=A0A5J5IJP5_9BACT|nr:50S ribosomal protein L11 methyltransferase [Ginsengibacter hankyongi]KAA9038595.1 50S ribosomal protein L11 methyltransferase [Ginsengibacter hankyongi]